MTVYLKDPAATLGYTVDWTASYLVDDSITASSWTLQPVEEGGLEILGSDIENNITSIRVTGGINGHVYRVANRITLAGGETDERDVLIRVGERS
ncbi:MAG: hypothetical protein ACFBZ9_06125 [Sphingomonadales bacterium]